MRSYPVIYLLIFILIYALITIGTCKSILRINKSNKKIIRWIIYLYSLLVILSFTLIYIWPDHTGSKGKYALMLIFNALLSADFIFKIPQAISFLVGLIFSKRNRIIVSWMGLLIAIGLSGNVLFASIFERHLVTVKRVELTFDNLPPAFEGYTIMQISDLHLGSFMHSKKNLEETTRLVHKVNPDVLFFTGDLVNNYSNELKGWADVFKAMNKGTTSISILGNHDYGNYSRWKSKSLKEENFEEIVEAHKQFGFHLLRNENTVLRKGNDSIFVIGVENWGLPPFPQYADLGKALINVPEKAFKILLSHDPAHWDSVVKYMNDISLTLSGHTHGMQWGIKRAGITFSPMYFVRHEWGGLYNYGKSLLYVNTGLGTIGVPWRIDMPGEVTLITLKRTEID